ncbi:hypothetical protein [Puniceicoccus vermicola]|uniref:Uncharacterized protein n=1 Tax=Puniceicoccus vermicola TaxID=388746 RepID=A0A7X1E4J8_9BACT|nr:hypothetical protein [Puniceicoccus vermicola]MBC2602073.1 hypothetical protein [Puniceicoccus vermicola]
MSKPQKLSQSQIASALGVSRQYVNKLKKQGMPVDSVDAAKAWRDENSQRGTGFRSGSNTDEISIPEDELDTSPQAALKRAEVAEAKIGWILDSAIKKGDTGKIQSLLRLHSQATASLTAAKKQFLEIQEQESRLIGFEKVAIIAEQTLSTLIVLLDALPDESAALIAPDEPEPVRKVIADKVSKLKKTIRAQLEEVGKGEPED